MSAGTLRSYLPDAGSSLPAVVEQQRRSSDFSNEREILYKVLFDMKSDLNDLKKLTLELLKNESTEKVQEENRQLIRKIYGEDEDILDEESAVAVLPPSRGYQDLPLRPAQPAERVTPAPAQAEDRYHFAEEIEEEETLSLQEKEIELIRKALERNKGKRKAAAAELGISERTLYRKIKQYDL